MENDKTSEKEEIRRMARRTRSRSSVRNVREQACIRMDARLFSHQSFAMHGRHIYTNSFTLILYSRWYVCHRSWVFSFHIRSCRTFFSFWCESLSCFLSYMHNTHVLSTLSSLFDLAAAAADAVPCYSSFSFLFVAHVSFSHLFFISLSVRILASVGFCWCSNSATV